jgi:hypothetical protein
MQLFRIILAVVVIAIADIAQAAAVPVTASVEPTAHAVAGVAHDVAANAEQASHGEHHGLPANAVKVFNLGPVVITNSMVVTILVTLGIVIFAQLVSRNVTAVPTGLQNFAEWLVESMYNFLGEILGPKLV